MDEKTLADIGKFQMHLLEAKHALRRARKYLQAAESAEFDHVESRLLEMLNRVFGAELDATLELMKTSAIAIYRRQTKDDSPNVSARIETNHDDRSWIEICWGSQTIATIEIQNGEPGELTILRPFVEGNSVNPPAPTPDATPESN